MNDDRRSSEHGTRMDGKMNKEQQNNLFSPDSLTPSIHNDGQDLWNHANVPRRIRFGDVLGVMFRDVLKLLFVRFFSFLVRT